MINNIGNVLKLTIFCLLVAGVSCSRSSAKATGSLPIAFGDPFVISASDGNYYMYGTGGVKDGFIAYRSADLIEWDSIGQVYRADANTGWCVANFWAPEVYEKGGKYYIFFSADRRENPSDELENFRIGVAVSDSPAGPFVDLVNAPLFDPGYPIIDANILVDGDRYYLYYSRCCYKHPVESEVASWARERNLFEEIEESWIYGVELSPDFSSVIGEPVLLMRPPVSMGDIQSEWESRSVTSAEVNRRWTEGPLTLRRGDTYYMMYSANSFEGEHYAVGYATASSPLGPYLKADCNPILEKNTASGGDVTGTGHNSMVYSKDGKILYCVYHGRTTHTGKNRVVFIDTMTIEDNGKIVVHGPTRPIHWQSKQIKNKK